MSHGFDSRYPLHADVAQLVEQFFRKEEVGGSNPLIGSIEFNKKHHMEDIKKSVKDNSLSIYLFIASIVLFFVDLSIWRKFLSFPDIYIYNRIGIYPVKVLLIMIIVNTSLSLFSFKKEKEIGYLLLSGSVFIAILVLFLELFYLINK